MLKNPITFAILVSFVFLSTGCKKETEEPAEPKKTGVEKSEAKETEEKKAEKEKTKEIVVGGYYAFPNKGGKTFVIMKVLDLEKKIVHIRRYVNRYDEVPKDLDISTLTLGDVGMPGNTGVPHMALGIDWFWPTKPVLLTTKPVTEEEKEVVRQFRENRKKK